MLTAADLHSRGLEESNAGRHASGRRIFRQALERADVHDADLLARIQLSLAHVEAELGSAAQGLEISIGALQAPGLSRQVRGLIHSQLGLLHMRAGDGTQALPEFAEAIRLLDASPEPLATAYLNRGFLFLFRGEVSKASSDLEAAMAYAEEAAHPLLQAKAQHNLGYARMMAGDLASALSMMEAARPSWADQSPTYRALCEQDRAEVLIAAGMTSAAADALRLVAKTFGARRLRQRQAEAEYILARLLAVADPAEARKVAGRSSRRFERRGSHAWALRADAVAIVCDIEIGRRGEAVAQRADQLASTLREHRLLGEAVVLRLQAARALVRGGNVARAAHVVRTTRLTRQAPLPTRILQREVQTEIAIARGHRAAAQRQVRQGLAELHEWQSSFGSLDLQSSLVGHGRRLALQGLRLAVSDGRPDVVFEWSERARALASRVTPVRPPVDAQAAEQIAELRGLHGEIAEAESEGRPAPSELVRRSEELSAQIRQRQWYDAGSGVVAEPTGIAEVGAAVAAAAGALTSYLVVEDRLHALVIADGRETVHDLGSFGPVRSLLEGMQADLDMAASHLPAQLRAPVQAGLDARLAALAERLVAPLAAQSGDGPIAIVPAGSLAGVPWTLLPGLVGRPLTVPRSATSWLANRAVQGPAGRAGFVAGPRVPRAEEEVDRAAKTWATATVLRGDQSRSAAVAELASNVDVFHVAAHGRHSADNPLFSGLELVDGPWFGYDIDSLASIPSTVILSSCELGRSSVRWGEETIGMTVAWQHAGARTVIASPASVDDDVACFVLAATHHHLAAGVSPADALARASSDLGGVIPAPFVCFGSGW